MLKVLVVDDEENIRKIVRTYAEFERFEVFEAENGMRAVELCRSNDYDFIIMDIMMPGMDGFETSRTVTSQKLQGSPPIVMCSANATDEEVREAARLACVPLGDYLRDVSLPSFLDCLF